MEIHYSFYRSRVILEISTSFGLDIPIITPTYDRLNKWKNVASKSSWIYYRVLTY